MKTTNLNLLNFSLLSLYGAVLQVTAADPLSTWNSRTSPYGSTNSWEGVVFAEGKFVAVGSKGLVAISSDGTDWFPFSANSTKNFYSVAFGGSTFVGTGTSGLVATSSDGMTWQIQDPGSSAHLYHVSYNNGQFMAVSDGGVILSSPTGVTWTPHNTESTNKWRASAYGNGAYVVVGYRSGDSFSYTRSAASSTLSDWDVRDTGELFYLTGLTFGAGKFLACGYAGTLQSSVDGVNWSAAIRPGNAWLNFAAYANNTFVAVGESGLIQSSPDALTWTNRHQQSFTTLNAVAFGNNTWVAVGNSSLILQSDPVSGSSSSDRPVLTEATRVGSVFSFKFTGVSNQVYEIQGSTDLTNWTTISNITCTATPTPCSIEGQTMSKRFYRLAK